MGDRAGANPTQRIIQHKLENKRLRQKIWIAMHMPTPKANKASVRGAQRIHNKAAGLHVRTRTIPLHVPALGTAQRDNALLGEHIERQGVDALLVDDDKVLVRRVAHLPLFSRSRIYVSAKNIRTGLLKPQESHPNPPQRFGHPPASSCVEIAEGREVRMCEMFGLQ